MDHADCACQGHISVGRLAIAADSMCDYSTLGWFSGPDSVSSKLPKIPIQQSHRPWSGGAAVGYLQAIAHVHSRMKRFYYHCRIVSVVPAAVISFCRQLRIPASLATTPILAQNLPFVITACLSCLHLEAGTGKRKTVVFAQSSCLAS